FNRFMPWMMNPDGTELETLNHIGRHELGDYFVQSFLNDGELSEFIDDQDRLSDNRYAVDNLFSLREDPTAPGLYFATNGSEFYTHGAGQIVTISGSPSTNANAMVVTSITHPETADPTNNPSPQHSGLYRNPLPLRDGSVVAVHTAETRVDFNSGTREAPRSRYNFRIKQLVKSGKYWQAGAPLTAGIEKSVSYYDPDVLVEYSGELWELQPVELVSRERPVVRTSTVPAIEESVFDDAGITLLEFQAYLAELDLAMVVTRDVRSRDEADKQQPFTLRLGESGKNAVSGLQFLQGSQIRAYESFVSGRRTLAQLMGAILIPEEVKDSSSIGSYRIFPDGSVAAIVPAQRALSWQLVASSGEPIVRERYWVTFQPGEVRVCASCHGLNERDQNGAGVPRNKPEALRAILAWWKSASSRDIRNPDGYLVSPGGDEVQTVRLQVKRRGRRVTIRLPRRYPLSLIADAALVISNPKGKSIERSFGAQRSKIVSLPRRMSQGRITVNLVQGGAILFEKVIRGARR
ncbi:MAG: hypothetical protein KDD70_10035, partial [Bdellovibrionales bacterium]|nr:hypothetical protein [Bdellovibrionales bacterium]